jgi:hypothetical protein
MTGRTPKLTGDVHACRSREARCYPVFYFYITFYVTVNDAGNKCSVWQTHLHSFFLNTKKVMFTQANRCTLVFLSVLAVLISLDWLSLSHDRRLWDILRSRFSCLSRQVLLTDLSTGSTRPQISGGPTKTCFRRCDHPVRPPQAATDAAPFIPPACGQDEWGNQPTLQAVG